MLAAGQLACAAVISVPLAVITNSADPSASRPAVLGLLALGVFGTGAAYVLNYRLNQDEGPTVASTVTYLLPVVAVTLGVAVLSEPVTLASLVGAAAILSGVALVQHS